MRIIAGPCQHESIKQSYEIAKECARVCKKYGIDYYFKASYDKANRTNVNGKRGVGLQTTMEDFITIKKDLGIKTLTDVHNQNETLKLFHESRVGQIMLERNLGNELDYASKFDQYNIVTKYEKGKIVKC